MSRSKKSRKPGGAPTAKPKLSKQELEKVDKRTRKTTGKVAGNRQKEAAPLQNERNQSKVNKDPRLGNKTPIALGKIVTKADKPKQAKPKVAESFAEVRFVEEPVEAITPALSPEEELEAIEQDQTLLAILAKQEDDIELSEQEVNYYNDKIGRHEELSHELGIDNSEDDEEDNTPSTVSEDDLWNKLDGHDFSEFKEKE